MPNALARLRQLEAELNPPWHMNDDVTDPTSGHYEVEPRIALATMEVVNALPQLLDIAEAARNYLMANTIDEQARALTQAIAALDSRIAV